MKNSPSPRPSPQRRGRKLFSAGGCSPPLDLPSVFIPCSLSRGERDRVRASNLLVVKKSGKKITQRRGDTKTQRKIFVAPISLTPWLQPGEKCHGYNIEPFQRLLAFETVKTVWRHLALIGHRAVATVLMRNKSSCASGFPLFLSPRFGVSALKLLSHV